MPDKKTMERLAKLLHPRLVIEKDFSKMLACCREAILTAEFVLSSLIVRDGKIEVRK